MRAVQDYIDAAGQISLRLQSLHVLAVLSIDGTCDVTSFLYRAGRCGRFGRTGLVLSLVFGPEEYQRRDGRNAWCT